MPTPRKTIDQLPVKAAPEADDKIVIQDSGVTKSTTVGALWDGTQSDALDAHIADTSGAHVAQGISFSPSGSISSTDVQAAIEEVATAIGTITELEVRNTEAYTVQNGAGYVVNAGSLVGWFDTKGRLFLGLNALANPDGNAHARLPDFMFDTVGMRIFARSMSLATLDDPCDINLRRWGGNAGAAPYGAGSGGLGTIADLGGSGSGALIGQLRATAASVPYNGDVTTPGATAAETGAVFSMSCSDMPRKITDDGQASVPMVFEWNLARPNSHDFREAVMRLHPDGLQVGMKACEEGQQNALLQLRLHEGKNNSQLLTVTGAPTGGNFKIKFYPPATSTGFSTPVTTAVVSWSSTAVNVRTLLLAALQTIPGNIAYTSTPWASLTSADLNVTGGPLPGATITIEFTGLLGKMALLRMAVTEEALTGGTSPSADITRIGQNGISSQLAQDIIRVQHVTGGTGRYLYFRDGAGATVLSLAADKRLLHTGDFELDGTFDHDGTNVGFFGITPAVRAASMVQTYSTVSRTHAARTAVALTDNSGGSLSTTIDAITMPVDSPASVDALRDDLVANSLTQVRNAIAVLTREINRVRTDTLNTSQVLNALVDDMQLYGLEQ